MRFRKLGRTGLEVSVVGLGCGDFGGVGGAVHLVGKGLDRTQAFALMDLALEHQINWFDTAETYGGGQSEVFIGEWLKARGSSAREAVLLSSKVSVVPNGLSAGAIVRALEGSLRRLGTDRVDLYLMRGVDRSTPIEEKLGALGLLVRQGKVRHVGAANVPAAALEEALHACEGGPVRFEWVQSQYNLLAREDEDALLPLCAAHGLGYTPFSPLAGGWLADLYRPGEPYPADSRMALGHVSSGHLARPETFEALARLRALASARGESMPALAAAWVIQHPDVTAPVIGPHDPAQLSHFLRAVDLPLSPAERAEIAACFT